jgi:hypothetical protein
MKIDQYHKPGFSPLDGPFVAGPFVAGPFVAGPFVAGPFVARPFVVAVGDLTRGVVWASSWYLDVSYLEK